MLLAVAISYGQQNNCFTNSEVDSIYTKLQRLVKVQQQKTALKETIKVKDSIISTHLHTFILQESQKNVLQQQLQLKDNIIKANKKNTLKAYFKGSLVGAGVVLIIRLITYK